MPEMMEQVILHEDEYIKAVIIVQIILELSFKWERHWSMEAFYFSISEEGKKS